MRGTLCFAPISDFTLVAEVETVTATTNVNLRLRDGGGTIPLPFYGINCDAVIQMDGVGAFGVTASDGFTDINGCFITTITVTNGVANDAATVTCRDVAGEDTVDISVDIP